MKVSNVCVVGLGYVGLPVSLLLCASGIRVMGYDVNLRIVEALRSGVVTIKEPGLQAILKESLKRGLFEAHTVPQKADVYVIAVPTPITEDKKAELSYVQSATRSILPLIKPGDLVILESTVPPRCTRDVVGGILEESGLKAGIDFALAHCPERVLPGNALGELRGNARTVGGATPKCAERAADFYRSFVRGEIITTGLLEAEISKLAENAYRDANLAFANSLAAVCEAAGVSAHEVIVLANKHPRVNVLQPGPGVGGHCIPVDPWFLVEAFPEEADFMKSARIANDRRPFQIVEAVLEYARERGVANPVVTVLGITYKANVCDVRESPALVAIAELEKRGASVRVCDPVANGRSPVKSLELNDAVRGADVVVALVAHDQFRFVTPELLGSYNDGRVPLLFDACGVWTGRELAESSKVAV